MKFKAGSPLLRFQTFKRCPVTRVNFNQFSLLILIWLILPGFFMALRAQDVNFEAMQRSLDADLFVSDTLNGDGVYIARSSKTGKWGMFQIYDQKKFSELVPMHYDSLTFFMSNAPYTAVYKNGLVGFYLSKWTYGDEAGESVSCFYEAFVSTKKYGQNYLAVSKNEKWAWIDFFTGETKTDFIFSFPEDLPKPNW